MTNLIEDERIERATSIEEEFIPGQIFAIYNFGRRTEISPEYEDQLEAWRYFNKGIRNHNPDNMTIFTAGETTTNP